MSYLVLFLLKTQLCSCTQSAGAAERERVLEVEFRALGSLTEARMGFSSHIMPWLAPTCLLNSSPWTETGGQAVCIYTSIEPTSNVYRQIPAKYTHIVP